MQKKYIVGLWNSDEKYKKTRHNAGSIYLTHFAQSHNSEFEYDKFINAFTAKTIWNNSELYLFLPDTYMNLSGEVIAKIIKKYDIKSAELSVIFDDVNVKVGEYKISQTVGASSHNGIKSILEHCVKGGFINDFTRIRIGVGRVLPDGTAYRPSPTDMTDYVLGSLDNVELDIIKNLNIL
jgi:peptidyl-tRNA hydrolase, PTH1 family